MLGLFLLNSGLYFFPLYSAPFLMISICCACCRVECVRPVGTVVQRPMRGPVAADFVIRIAIPGTSIIAAIIMDGPGISMSQTFSWYVHIHITYMLPYHRHRARCF